MNLIYTIMVILTFVLFERQLFYNEPIILSISINLKFPALALSSLRSFPSLTKPIYFLLT